MRRDLPWLLIPLALAVAAGFALKIDCAISQWWITWENHWQYSKFVNTLIGRTCDLLTLFENFGNGLGVTVILITIFVADPAKRWRVPRR